MDFGRIGDAVMLRPGTKMPLLGLGVFRTPEGHAVEHAVGWALEAGYRLIDTAKAYGNEAGVGAAVRASGIPRAEVFVTTKVWNSDQGFDSTLRAFDESFAALGLGYVDLYLVHWPVQGKYKDTWRALERIHEEGRARAIGVCNFQMHHMDDLLDSAKITPAVNQVECHPLLSQEPLLGYCKNRGIQLEAWGPLIRGNLEIPVLEGIARAHGKTAAQVALRWNLQRQVVVIPKSVRQERILENAALFDFTLSPEEMHRIDSLNEDRRFGPDPDRFNF